jgi:ABC-type transport system involved in multi-copper enzyme maturation permease subunit
VKSARTSEVVSLSVVFVVALVVGAVGISKTKSPVIMVFILFFFVLGIAIVAGARYLTTLTKSKADVAAHVKYRGLADEYRRLADMAITTQEQTDMKLSDIGVQMDFLREQLAAVQKILKEIE